MDNNNGKENAPNQQQQMAILQENEDGMSVPNWLLEVLAWISRVEMANSSLSYSCKLFKLLCWPKLHENVKPHKIRRLHFYENWDSNSGYLGNPRDDQLLPIPNVPPPPYILGFNSIEMRCRFLDDQVLEFFQNILQWLNRIHFDLYTEYGWMRGEKKIKAFGRLLDLLTNKIVQFHFTDDSASFNGSARIFEFNQLFPGFIQKVNYLCASNLRQSPTPTEFGILFDWLALPPPSNAEKQQKILQFRRRLDEYETNKFIKQTNKFIERIKEEFSCARAPLNFFIKFPFNFPIAHFNMENGETGEILTGMKEQIVRCPKGEENRWNEEGENKTHQWWIRHTNETYIDFFV